VVGGVAAGVPLEFLRVFRGWVVRQVIVLLGFFALAPAVQAQMGPSTARYVSRNMPSKAPAAQTFTAEADLTVHTDGEVGSIDIVTGSGDADFDKQWKKAMSNWQFVPAVDAGGVPVQSTVRVVYKNNGLLIGAPAGNAVTESERIGRMSCKDFDWEYRIVTGTLARRFALLDPLLKTPKIMLIAENNLAEPQLTLLNERYDETINGIAKHCRDNPTDAFWKAVAKPALEAALTAQ
jgi:TonB family protein